MGLLLAAEAVEVAAKTLYRVDMVTFKQLAKKIARIVPAWAVADVLVEPSIVNAHHFVEKLDQFGKMVQKQGIRQHRALRAVVHAAEENAALEQLSLDIRVPAAPAVLVEA